MIFVRIALNHTRGMVIGVMTQDAPFTTGGRIYTPDEECEMVDLGAVDDHAWTSLGGGSCEPAQHIRERIEHLTPAAVKAGAITAELVGVSRFHDAPCTMDGIRSRLRAKGPAGLPAKVRAWLTTILAPHEVAAMGIGRGIPISALKAAEAIRSRRDPHGGSRREHFQRRAQRMSDERARAFLEARGNRKEG